MKTSGKISLCIELRVKLWSMTDLLQCTDVSPDIVKSSISQTSQLCKSVTNLGLFADADFKKAEVLQLLGVCLCNDRFFAALWLQCDLQFDVKQVAWTLPQVRQRHWTLFLAGSADRILYTPTKFDLGT